MLALRPFVADDVDHLLAWRNHPDVARWMYTDHSITPSEHAQWFERARKDTHDHLNRILDVDGAARAVVSLTVTDADGDTAEWGGYVVPDGSGRGHGAAALVLSLALAFDDLAVDRVRVEAFARNARAVTLYRRTGFRPDQPTRRFVSKGLDRLEVVALSMTRSDWAEVGPGALQGALGGGVRR